MPYETKPGDGSLFVNQKEHEKQPDRTGKLVCPTCEAELRLSGWLRTTKDGKPWLSISAQPKTPGGAPAPVKAEKEFNDEIPF